MFTNKPYTHIYIYINSLNFDKNNRKTQFESKITKRGTGTLSDLIIVAKRNC